MNRYVKIWTKEGSQELTVKEWFDFNQELPHRLDGPAIEWSDGTKEWCIDGKRHRLDGPAIEYADGTKHWLVDGKRHRLDGPATVWLDGTKEWCVDGKRHRLDGPAIEYVDGTKNWFIDGKSIDTEEVENWLGENKVDLKTAVGQMAFKLKWL